MHLHSGPVFLRVRVRETRAFKKPPIWISAGGTHIADAGRGTKESYP